MKLRTVLIAGGVTVTAFVVGAVVAWPHPSTPAAATVGPPSADFVNIPPGPAVLGDNVIPPDVTWVLTNQIAVPISPTAGPTRLSPEGIRSGFAHTPSGALLAAANWAAGEIAVTQQTSPADLIDQRMMHWPGYNEMLAWANRSNTHTGLILQIAGFEFLAYDGDHATVLVAQHLTAPATAGTDGFCPWLNLVWTNGDWFIVPNISGLLEVGIPLTWPLSGGWSKFAGVA